MYIVGIVKIVDISNNIYLCLDFLAFALHYVVNHLLKVLVKDILKIINRGA